MMPRVAGAPISWGVCEVPGWGYQMEAERVLDEAARLGLTALEAGPDGFLPGEPEEMADLLSEHGLELVGGFVPAVLHRPQARDSELASVERQAGLFAAAGAGVLVIAATTGEEGYEESAGLEDDEWDELFATLARSRRSGPTTASAWCSTLTTGRRSKTPNTCSVSSRVATRDSVSTRDTLWSGAGIPSR